MILISTNIKIKGVHGSLRVTKNRKNILSMRTCLKRTKKEKKISGLQCVAVYALILVWHMFAALLHREFLNLISSIW